MSIKLIRLLQLVSPTLPVGAYTYSQGLEWAVETNVVKDESSALNWIGDCLEYGSASFEAVYIANMIALWEKDDLPQLGKLDAEFIASRETAELRAETLQMGHSLTRLLTDMGNFPMQSLNTFTECSFPLSWSCAAAAWEISTEDALTGYLWAWIENQIMATMKAVPLGQTAGQRMLFELGRRLPSLVNAARKTHLNHSVNYLPAFAIASSCHETQYTRLFRS